MEQNSPTPTPTPSQPITPTPSATSTSPAKKKKRINKTLLLVIGLIIFTLILLAITLTVKRSSLPMLSNDDVAKNMQNIAHTSVTVSNDVRTASGAGTYQTDVTLEPNGNKVTGVQLELSYDPKVITVTDITPGTFFANPNVLDKQIDTQTGKVKFTVGTAFGSDPVTENGTAAIITFKKIGEGSVIIDVLPSTLVTDSRYSQSVLDTSVSADIENLPSTASSGSANPSNQ